LVTLLLLGTAVLYAGNSAAETQKTRRWHVSDNSVTNIRMKLVWQDNSIVKSSKKNWEAAVKYCKNLSLDRYSDWRLPSYDELLTIVDYSKRDPAIVDGFRNVASDFYWSETEYTSDPGYVWTVYFEFGITDHDAKSYEGYVRCVRKEP